MGNGGKQQAIQIDGRIRFGGQIVKSKPPLAHVCQMVDIIDDRQRARGKGVALFLKAQGLLADVLQQSGQSIPDFRPGVPQYLQLRGHGLDLGHSAGRIAVPSPCLQVNLDHDQGCDNRENRQEQRGCDADPVLSLDCQLQIFLRLAELVVNLMQLGLNLLGGCVGVQRCGRGSLPGGRRCIGRRCRIILQRLAP